MVEAIEYARRVSCSPWEFAIEIHELYRLGLTINELRFLVRIKLLHHADEVPTMNSSRHFAKPADMHFTSRTCFLLTPAGFAAAIDQLNRPSLRIPRVQVTTIRVAAPAAIDQRQCVPVWEAARRILTYGGHLIKQFKWKAANQQAVLSAFQEEGWPTRIDDPLVPSPSLDVKRRLSDTIKCLNRGRVQALICFRGDGSGQGVTWEAVAQTKMMPVQGRDDHFSA